MTSRILSIGTAVPETQLDQGEVRDFFLAQPGIERLASRLIRSAFDYSAIDSRYSVIREFEGWLPSIEDGGESFSPPSTGERNAIYRQAAPHLFAAAARDALTRSGFAPQEVTHVVTASCTGFFAPGPDFMLVKDLGIPRTAERIHIGFMGCAAALPALRSAARISELHRQAVVLVVCAELCSIHIRSSSDPEQIVASAVFGDGAAAAVVSSREERVCGPVLEIGEFATHVTDEGEGDLDWTIGDHGFEMRLSARVPRIIEHEISGVVNTVLRDSTDPARHVDVWAVHPGGRSVLDRAEAGLGLPDGAIEHSRAVLRDYGNMSSATLLFILQRIMDDDALGDAASVAGLGFGPGLTVEMALFSRRATPTSQSMADTRGTR